MSRAEDPAKARKPRGEVDMKRMDLAIILLASTVFAFSALPAQGEQREALVFSTRTGVDYFTQDGAMFARLRGEPETRIPVFSQRIIAEISADVDRSSVLPPGLADQPGAWKALGDRFVVIDVPPGDDPVTFLRNVGATPGVVAAEFDLQLEYFAVPDDPLFGSQWGFQNSVSHVPAAWDLETGDPILVGVVDEGVDMLHEDLIWILDSASDPAAASEPHGTAVVGIIGAITNNFRGVAGVAGGWGIDGGVRIRVKKPLGSASDLLSKIEGLGQAGARVVNLSLGILKQTPTCGAAYAAQLASIVNQYDLVICAASGNAGGALVSWPACDPNVLGVGAILEDGIRWACSSYGPQLDIVAPGGCGIVTTDLTGAPGYSASDYTVADDCYAGTSCNPTGTCPVQGCFGGTSASAPFATGVAALVRSTNPALTWREVSDILRHTADKVPAMGGALFHQEYGFGRVNAEAAVLAALRIPADGVIRANTTWSGKSVLGRDIVVNPGVTLTIAQGSELIFSLTDALDHEPFFTDRVELHVRGHLQVNGTAGSKVQFRSCSATPSETDWVHIQVLGAGSLTMNQSELRHAEWGIGTASTGSLSIANSTLESNSAADIRFFGNPSTASITNCVINVGSGGGVELAGADATISGNTITGTAASAHGIKVDNDTSAGIISGNTITGFASNYGILLGRGTSTVTSNTVTGCLRGIQAQNGTHTIGATASGNTLSGNTGSGLYIVCIGPGACPASCTLAATVRGNSISNNGGDGVTVQKTAVGANLGTPGSDGNNTFTNNGGACIANLSSCGTVSAWGNYFGQCPPPSCTTGAVDVSNALCSPPMMPRVEFAEAEAEGESRLLMSAPNPFNPTVRIRFVLGRDVETGIEIFDTAGRRVRQAALGDRPAGSHEWTWNGSNDRGEPVGSGIYLVVLRAGDLIDSHRIVLMK